MALIRNAVGEIIETCVANQNAGGWIEMPVVMPGGRKITLKATTEDKAGVLRVGTLDTTDADFSGEYEDARDRPAIIVQRQTVMDQIRALSVKLIELLKEELKDMRRYMKDMWRRHPREVIFGFGVAGAIANLRTLGSGGYLHQKYVHAAQ
ncbi:MAG: hypothetical protein MMC33_000524 [Icmadophila ericetorum]|nr:hypothetical protein [Icmadophila ericetorum]